MYYLKYFFVILSAQLIFSIRFQTPISVAASLSLAC